MSGTLPNSTVSSVLIWIGEFKLEQPVLGAIADLQNKVPCMFKMPGSKDEFLKYVYPGHYEEVASRYSPGTVVKELDSVEVKHVCLLKAIMQNHTFLVIPSEESLAGGEARPIEVQVPVEIAVETARGGAADLPGRSVCLREGGSLPGGSGRR
jgi:hypothetical protein